MTDTPAFHLVTADQLHPILDILVPAVTGHTPFDHAPTIAQQLGWTYTRRHGGKTALPVNLQGYTIFYMDMKDGSQEIVSVGFRVSDTLFEGTTASRKKIVKAAFPAMVHIISDYLGYPPTRLVPFGGLAGQVWDLPQGGQIDLSNGEDCILLDVKAQWETDLELEQLRLGYFADTGKPIPPPPQP